MASAGAQGSMPNRVLVTGIRLTNLRVFEGEHFFPVAEGLTVLMGRNNSGKSTVLRAPTRRPRAMARNPKASTATPRPHGGA